MARRVGRLRIGEVLTFIAGLAFLLAAFVVKDNAILPTLAFFILAQFFLRLLILLLPSLGKILLGTGKPRAESPNDHSPPEETFLAVALLCCERRYSEALAVLESHGSHAAGRAWWALMHAWCLAQLGRVHDAIRALEVVAEQVAGEPLVHYALACYWCRAGSVPRALDSLSQAIELDPGLREAMADDPDLEPLRDEEDYARLARPAESVS
jgi:tetratricopeptide (TPR) repeat protein